MIRYSLLLVVLLPHFVWAEVPALSFNSLFPGSREMYASSMQNERYRLILSAPKKINSRWQFDREERIDSTVIAATYELNSSFSLEDVTTTMDRHMNSAAARTVFLCDGLDCGSSNVWANEVFEVKQLYGLDQYQAYRVWDLNTKQGTSFLVAYIAQRGNGRLYAQVEQVRLASATRLHLHASPKTLLQTLAAHKFYVAAQIPEEIEAVARALASRPTLKVYVVGHDAGRGDLESLKVSSLEMAQKFAEQLVLGGARESQIIAQGVGPLAPRQGFAPDRIEIVLR
ncbi:outer membrane protein OmpA-like peptidoglycan-associated protein [Alteromonadaceae bacterium 2753L.S.0a.02]|nr:outer membrane protein OmpA-like peptidoglycan-associated protein [Alteromonadaceae bacterium 2753L.S.0a.02]